MDYDQTSVHTAADDSGDLGAFLPWVYRLIRLAVVFLIAGCLATSWIQIRLIGTGNFWWYFLQAREWLPGTIYHHYLIAAEGLAILLLLWAVALLELRKRWKKINIPFSNRRPSGSGLHGTADWASFDEIRDMSILPPRVVSGKDENAEGVFIGAYEHKGKVHYLRHNGPEHVLAFAPTRSGKGVGLVLPTLLTWEHSVLIHDPKGEAWNLTSGFRHTGLHQKTFNFDPANPKRSEVAAFNPLAEVRIGEDYEVGDAQNIATILVDPDGNGLKDHWDKTGQALMAGLILHTCYYCRNEYSRAATFEDVVEFFCRPGLKLKRSERGEPPGSLDLMVEYDHTGHGPHPMVAQEGQTMLNKDERELASVVSTVISYLTLYRDPVIARNTSASDWKIQDLMFGDRPASAYLVVRPSDADRLRPLMRLIATQIVRQLTGKMEFKDGRSVAHYNHRLLLLLDEFTALKKLTVIEDALAYMAGYGLKAYLIVQDIQQLQAVYGREETVISNCHVRLCFAPNKFETAKMISEMAGSRTVVHKSAKVKASEKPGGETYHETSRALITPEEVMRLRGAQKDSQGDIKQPGDLLIFTAGHRPLYGLQVMYFLDPILLKRSRIPPPALRFGNESSWVKEETFNLSRVLVAEDDEKTHGDVIAGPWEFNTRNEINAFVDSITTLPAGVHSNNMELNERKLLMLSGERVHEIRKSYPDHEVHAGDILIPINKGIFGGVDSEEAATPGDRHHMSPLDSAEIEEAVEEATKESEMVLSCLSIMEAHVSKYLPSLSSMKPIRAGVPRPKSALDSDETSPLV